MQPKKMWREFLLLCTPIILVSGIFVATNAKSWLPPQELQMDSCQFVEPTTLERYLGYNGAIETRWRRPANDSSQFEYVLSDAKGKRWRWGDFDTLEIYNGGLTIPQLGSRVHSGSYRCALWTEKVFGGTQPVTFAWYKPGENYKVPGTPDQEISLSQNEFRLPRLEKPQKASFELTKIEWIKKDSFKTKSIYVDVDLRFYVKAPQINHYEMLPDWHFSRDSKKIERILLTMRAGSSSYKNPEFLWCEVMFEKGKTTNQIKGRLSVNQDWPLEITADLPPGWESAKNPLDLKFTARVADPNCRANEGEKRLVGL